MPGPLIGQFLNPEHLGLERGSDRSQQALQRRIVRALRRCAARCAHAPKIGEIRLRGGNQLLVRSGHRVFPAIRPCPSLEAAVRQFKEDTTSRGFAVVREAATFAPVRCSDIGSASWGVEGGTAPSPAANVQRGVCWLPATNSVESQPRTAQVAGDPVQRTTFLQCSSTSGHCMGCTPGTATARAGDANPADVLLLLPPGDPDAWTK